MYHDDLRVKRNAEFFDRTDNQLAAECGLGIDQFARARDLITADGIELFEKTRRGVPAINHYRANYERIHAWLTVHGFGQVELPQGPPGGASTRPGSSLPKTGKLDTGKPANLFAENQPPLKEFMKEFIDDDDAERARSIDSVLNRAGIENPTRLQIVTVWCRQNDGVDVINRVTSVTYDEFLLLERTRGGRKIKSYAGLVVARLRGEYEQRTGKSATDIPPADLAAVRAVLASVEVRA